MDRKPRDFPAAGFVDSDGLGLRLPSPACRRPSSGSRHPCVQLWPPATATPSRRRRKRDHRGGPSRGLDPASGKAAVEASASIASRSSQERSSRRQWPASSPMPCFFKGHGIRRRFSDSRLQPPSLCRRVRPFVLSALTPLSLQRPIHPRRPSMRPPTSRRSTVLRRRSRANPRRHLKSPRNHRIRSGRF